MKGKLKLLYAVIAAVFLCLPVNAQETTETTDNTVKICDVAANHYPSDSQTVICTLAKTSDDTYTGIATGLNQHQALHINVLVFGDLYGCSYKSVYSYSNYDYDKFYAELASTTFSKGASGNQYIEFDANKFPYENARFTVTINSDDTLTLAIEEAIIIPDAPAAGSKIIVTGYNSSNAEDGNYELVNSAEEPYIFTGSFPLIGHHHFKFSYGEVQYGLMTGESFTDLPYEVELQKSKEEYFKYDTDASIDKVNVKAVLSNTQQEMTVTIVDILPASVVIDGVEEPLCDDLNQASADRYEYGTSLIVDADNPTPIAVNINGKSYGVAEGAISFDESDRNMQERQAALVEGGKAVTLAINGIYTVALVRVDGEWKLSITKEASDKLMIFGKGNAMTYDDETKQWTGTFKLKRNQDLPPFKLIAFDESGVANTTSYWFSEDIDGADRAEHTATLTTSESSVKSLSAGTYEFTLTINNDGTATVTYINPDIVIKDLYVCVYDKQKQLKSGSTSEYELGYKEGNKFSFDYKVTYQSEDGSYAIALCLNAAQSFYIINDGKEYRPQMEDVETSFGNGVDNMNYFIFTEADANDETRYARRKYVSTVAGYRMLLLTPEPNGIRVSGYKLDLTHDEKHTKMMNIVRSLTNPTDELGHMADVIVKFTGGTEQGVEYLNEYRKMKLNPSGTHGLEKLNLKAGQTFEIYRGRAIYDAAGNITGIEEDGKVQYGCSATYAKKGEAASLTDGDISQLVDQYSTPKTTTYKVVCDGQFNFLAFYTTLEKEFTVSRKLQRDRGISIAVYDKDNKRVKIVDMQYKNVNRRNLMTVEMPKGGYVQFGFCAKDNEGNYTEFEPIQFYYLGLSNEVGYDSEPTEENKDPKEQFYAIESDYPEGADTRWYRFRLRLREDGKYYVSHQVVPMPSQVWLYVNKGSANARTYTAVESEKTPGHYIFKGVTLNKDDKYYFVNRENGEVDANWTLADGSPADGLIWYAAHKSSWNGFTDGNPVIPGHWINMFSHLNVGTDYQNGNYSFLDFTYSNNESLKDIDIDMDITTMSHRISFDYSGQYFQFVGNCAGVQERGIKDWDLVASVDQYPEHRFEYHPSTGYYTCFLDYLWGDWFIYGYEVGDDGKTLKQMTPYSPFNLNNVIHELNRPYYLSDSANRYVSDLKKQQLTGTGAKTEIKLSADGSVPSATHKDRFMIALAPGATSIIQTSDFQSDWVHSPVYKDVTVVFDPANSVLWLESGRTDGAPDIEDPYGELYIVFTDVTPVEWDKARSEELAAGTSVNRGAHWVKLNRDPNKFGHYTAEGVEFPARKINDGSTTRHASYFFTNRLGETLEETIRYSNSYEAGIVIPTFADATQYESMYGSIFTKLDYNNDGNFKTEEKPLSLVKAVNTVNAKKIYLRRWDNVDGAPFNECIIPGMDGGNKGAAPRRAEGSDGGDTGAADGGTTDTPSDIVMADEDPASATASDYVMRTFSSEPYVYNVDVHLGRKEFTLLTPGHGDIETSIDELPVADDVESGCKAVVRTAAGHISVTGAASVSIYTLTGQCLISNAPGAELDVMPGIYIVVADGRATKHVL